MQESPQKRDGLAQFHRKLRFLRLLLFQDQICASRPRFGPLPVRVEQKQTTVPKSVIAAGFKFETTHGK
jgi:hypothetical protein